MHYNGVMFSGSNSISQFNKKNIAIWLSMAFQGGTINAGGFLACHRFVTHTTGFATNFGAEMALGNAQAAFGLLTVPAFFLIGAMTSGFFVERNIALGKSPRYEWMFGFIVITMLYVAISGSFGGFGSFGEPLNLTHDYVLLVLLCLCSGIQNATITSASGAVVRTTHLTGITTDLGIGLIRVFTTGRTQAVRTNEARVNWMRIGIIFSFALGSTVSAFIYYRYQYWGFLTPAAISLMLMALTVWKRRIAQRLGVGHARAS
jgi:uncharacterized membrane protein YoaK (UPF0700 family)